MSLKDPKAVGAAEFKARCLELIDHVHDGNVEYVVTRHGTPVAKLVPAGTPAAVSALGSMRGTVLRYDDPFEPVPAAWAIDQPEPPDQR